MQPKIRLFVSELRSPVTPFDRGKTIAKSAYFAKNAHCFEKCNVFGNGKCELSATKEGRNGANFWQGKVQNSSPISAFWQGKVQTSSPISARLR